eukprot:9499890-Pyramimonas_sp.AAC.1
MSTPTQTSTSGTLKLPHTWGNHLNLKENESVMEWFGARGAPSGFIDICAVRRAEAQIRMAGA